MSLHENHDGESFARSVKMRVAYGSLLFDMVKHYLEASTHNNNIKKRTLTISEVFDLSDELQQANVTK